jgi:diacylglycerol kinase
MLQNNFVNNTINKLTGLSSSSNEEYAFQALCCLQLVLLCSAGMLANWVDRGPG